MKCTFDHFGKCTILTETKCSPKCKFRKTDDEYLLGQTAAAQSLESKGLERILIHTNEGPKITVRRKIDED